jgi:glycosyltransferase involved in cell wall biosynthesis
VTTVHVVVPGGIDDPLRPSGGNVYDRRVCHGLAVDGWAVHEHAVPGRWPRPDQAAGVTLARVLGGIPHQALVLLDGLVASAVPEVLGAEAGRLRLVVLVHLPLGADPSADGDQDARTRERAALSAATAVVATSGWARRWLLERYALPIDRVHVVEPGADIADVAAGTTRGGQLLCVGAVTPVKGYDVLVAALAGVRDRAWHLACVGALDVDPGFVGRVRGQAEETGIVDRVGFVGPLTRTDLERTYAEADLLVLASRVETYGMVVTEALAHGLPVVATNVGGVPEALGRAPDGSRPGLLVRPGDPLAFAAALRCWLDEPDRRVLLRRAAQARRPTLSGWSDTTRRMSRVLTGVPG